DDGRIGLLTHLDLLVFADQHELILAGGGIDGAAADGEAGSEQEHRAADHLATSNTMMMTASTKTSVEITMVCWPLAAARDEPSHVVRRASVGSARWNSGESRGPGSALGELRPAELTGTVARAESGAC